VSDGTEAQAELLPIERDVEAPLATRAKPADSDFDWRHDESVIIGHQPRSACYWNPASQIVIRQERDAYEDDDPFLILNPESAGALVSDLLLKQIEAGRYAGATPAQLRRLGDRLHKLADAASKAEAGS
jgi:hypothetical protein